MTTETLKPIVPGMHAETGFEMEESVPPLRVSGFLCLLTGLLSFLCLLFQPMLLLPVATFILGAIALRRSDGPKPVGTRAALLGLVLAAGFGTCGFFLPWMKTKTLGVQAEQFARDYMATVALGHDEFAMELQKDYVNRMSTQMSLKEHYNLSERAMQELEEFRENYVNKELKKRGPDAEWVLERPVAISYSRGREHAELIWIDPTGESAMRIQMFMEYRVDSRGGGQWQMNVVQTFRERIVAENIL